jgi:pimeloyl-ACP methyl ester carboxylesterase
MPLSGTREARRSGMAVEGSGSREPDRGGRILGLSRTGFHEIAYVEWGPKDSEEVVICLHGLTRQGRDFDHLAAHLASLGRRVVCPDLVGRGRSGRLRDPQEYTLLQYCADMNALIAHTGASRVDWVGTSLGGLVGLVLAGLPGHPIRRLVINDIGPMMPRDGVVRISRYMAEMPTVFASLADAESYLREVLAPFGSLEDEHWAHLTRHSVQEEAGAGYRNLCDPMIVHAFRTPVASDINLWTYWDAVDVPMLLVRGRDSDLLPAYVAREMARRNRRMILHEVPGCGHAPTLMAQDQVETVAAFLTLEQATS